MSPAPKVPQFEQEVNPALYRRWIIWDPIPDWLDLKQEVIRQIFVIGLDAEREHLAVEQRKIDMVKELFMK
jgi:hypothetical protein